MEAPSEGDLSVTALYTSQVWRWGDLPGARLFDTGIGRLVFGAVTVALGIMKLFRWSLPALRHGLLQRHVAIDQVVERASVGQVLELAAGLSRRGVSMTGAQPELRYVEVDLPHVVARKRELLARTEAGRAAAERPGWQLVAADVADVDLGAHVDVSKPVVVIAEGLLMYLDAVAQRGLWARIAELLSRGAGGTFVFDLVPPCEQPQPGVIGRALAWCMGRFTGGRTFEVDARTRDDIEAELGAAGFDSVTLFDTQEIASEWGLPHPRRRTQQLLFVCTCGGWSDGPETARCKSSVPG